MRPKPIIMFESPLCRTTRKSVAILQADAVYAVFHDGHPIAIRDYCPQSSGGERKYRRTGFPSAAPAFNLADRLNRLFQTDKFAVHKLTSGEPIVEKARRARKACGTRRGRWPGPSPSRSGR